MHVELDNKIEEKNVEKKILVKNIPKQKYKKFITQLISAILPL